MLVRFLAQIPTPTPSGTAGLISREFDALAQILETLGFGLGVLFVIIVLAIVYWRTSTNKNSPNALMVQLITQLGHVTTGLNTLATRQLDNDETAIKQRGELIDVMKASNAVMEAVDAHLATLGQAVVEVKPYMEVLYADTVKRLEALTGEQKIFKGDVDVLNRHNEKIEDEIKAIKADVADIKKLLEDKAVISTEEFRSFNTKIEAIMSSLANIAHHATPASAPAPTEAPPPIAITVDVSASSVSDGASEQPEIHATLDSTDGANRKG